MPVFRFVLSLLFAVFLGFANPWTLVHAQVQGPAQAAGAIRMVPLRPAINAKETVHRQMRGLFQNELDIVGAVCSPDPTHSQKLVDVVEEQWFVKSRRELAKKLQQHVYGTVDMDGIAERTMQAWVSELLTKEQAALYDAELTDRMTYRRRALISKMLVWLQYKLQLSADQMDEVRKVLETKWKDRWFRSIEATFDNETLLPELNRSWLDTILTDAQRNALAIRVPQSRVAAASQEYPSLDEKTRFRINGIESSAHIKLGVENGEATAGNEK